MTLLNTFLCWLLFPMGVVANYELGDKELMCWTIVGNIPIDCPSGLDVDWVNDTLPTVLSVGVDYKPSVRIAVTKSVFSQLEDSHLLPSNHSAESYWVMCTQTNIPCSATTAVSCCYWHVNVHACQKWRGVFCGPWVANDSMLATHSTVQSGFAGVTGHTTFSFDVNLFWQGIYIVIAHFQLGNLQFAVGKPIELVFNGTLCEQTLVPKQGGGCEPCPTGHQAFDASWFGGVVPYTEEEARRRGVNPYCIPCPVGMYALNTSTRCFSCLRGSISSEIASSNCTLCEPGKFASLMRLSICSSCDEGKFSGMESKSCTSCPRGRFRNSTMNESLFGNASDCHLCPDGLTTLTTGHVNSDNCTCAPGFFLSPELGGCRKCLEGLVCEGGLDPPKQAFGYYALESRSLTGSTEHDYAVFVCDSNNLCAKGTSIGECIGNRDGLACSECFPGFYPHKDGTCHNCASSADVRVQISVAVLVGAAFFAFVGIGSMTRPRLTRGSMHALGTVATVFFMNIQALAAYCSLPIQWSIPMNYLESLITTFSINIDLIEPNCLFGVASVVGVFGVSIAAPPTTALYMFILWRVLKCCYVEISIDRLYNAVGVIFWIFFLTITLLAISPLHCLENPGGIMTVARYKGVMCWRGQTHKDLLVLSAIALTTQTFPVIGIVVYACFVYKAKMAQPGGVAFLKRFDFLYQQITSHSHKFVLMILARNLLLAIIPPIISTEVELSLVFITLVILVYTSVQGDWKPWKGQIANVLDRGSSLVLILVGIAGALLRSGSFTKAEQAAVITTWIVFTVAGSAFLIGVIMQIYLRLRVHKPFVVFLSHHKLGAGVTCRMMKEWLTEYTRGKVFYDSDELSVISDLHHIVAEHTQAFFLVLSSETLKRLWCCVEVVAAVKFRLPIVVICCDGASLLDNAFLAADLPQVWTHQQWSDLGVFGIDINIVRDCYTALRNMPNLPLDRFAPISAISDLVVEALHTAIKKGLYTTTKAEENKVHHVDLIIASNSFDGEAVMTCHLLALFLQSRLGRELAIVKKKEDVQNSSLAVWMLAVLTVGVLENCTFPALLAEALDKQIMLMPVRASDSFVAPSEATYTCLRFMTFDVPASVAIACYKTLFNTIALAFSTLGSKAILEIESTLIAGRLVFASMRHTSRRSSVSSNAPPFRIIQT